MPAIPISNHQVVWRGGSFTPQGKLQFPGRHTASNPAEKHKGSVVSGRLIVGFNVRDVPTWTIDDLIKLVRGIREKQGVDPSASFVAQRGIYRHREGRITVEEDGGQVFILNLSGAAKREFRDDMIDLGERIALAFGQESVILEIQKDGIVQSVRTITEVE